MRRIAGIFAFVTVWSVAGAQDSPVSIKGAAYYSVEHYWDSLSADNVFHETTVLFFGDKISLYRSYDRLQTEAAAKKNLTYTKVPGSSVIRVSGIEVVTGSRDLFYTNFDTHTITRVRPFYNPNYRMPEKFDRINWEILPETKKIGNYTCQKARAYVRGRLFTVWFCNDIPVPFGPWKLNGLPGLILEATDKSGTLSFRFQKFEWMNDTQEFIPPVSESAIVTTEIAFEKMRKAYYENPNTFSGAITSTGHLSGGTINTRKVVFNNPMDLLSKAPPMPYNY
ncbi:MAG TPA: GLPGLI family protein [Sediminibacterium sp.]|nr:GLPGLI family protein [Sediminibacterium sp.]